MLRTDDREGSHLRGRKHPQTPFDIKNKGDQPNLVTTQQFPKFQYDQKSSKVE